MIDNEQKGFLKRDIFTAVRRLKGNKDFQIFTDNLELLREDLIVMMRNNDDSTGMTKCAGGVSALTNLLDLIMNVEEKIEKAEKKKATFNLKALQNQARNQTRNTLF